MDLKKKELEEKEKTRKYYEAEKRKIENERREKEGLPLIPSSEELLAQ